jgi:hypothetical protein
VVHVSVVCCDFILVRLSRIRLYFNSCKNSSDKNDEVYAPFFKSLD